MKYNLFRSLKHDIWKILVWFIGWFIVIISNVPITYLTIFIVMLVGYIIGDILNIYFRNIKNNE